MSCAMPLFQQLGNLPRNQFNTFQMGRSIKFLRQKMQFQQVSKCGRIQALFRGFDSDFGSVLCTTAFCNRISWTAFSTPTTWFHRALSMGTRRLRYLLKINHPRFCPVSPYHLELRGYRTSFMGFILSSCLRARGSLSPLTIKQSTGLFKARITQYQSGSGCETRKNRWFLAARHNKLP